MQRVKAIVSGRVQSVGYRAWAVKQASALGLGGEIRNLSDKTVLVLMEGDESSVQQMLNALHRAPEPAQVKSVQVEELDYRGDLFDFVIRPEE